MKMLKDLWNTLWGMNEDPTPKKSKPKKAVKKTVKKRGRPKKKK
jgi:hypothetical protein|tara:strand:+ start:281 stop:412 length:132 start_codon:yes stop_codon:yes gene_type:complete